MQAGTAADSNYTPKWKSAAAGGTSAGTSTGNIQPAITQSFVDEGKVIGVVEYLRDEKMPDEKILEKIKDRFQLNDYQARTFVYPKEKETA